MSKQRQCKACQRIATANGYCDMHQAMAEQTKQDSKQRSGRAWRTRKARKFREQYLVAHPYCFDCWTIYGRPVPATTVHHVISQEERPDLAIEPSNVVSLCQACHDAREGRGGVGGGETFSRTAET